MDIKTVTIDMRDNLLMDEINEAREIVIDNNMENIKIDVLTGNDNQVNTYTYLTYGGSKAYYGLTINNYSDIDDFKKIKEVINDLKNKKIRVYNENYYRYQIDKIYISNNNLTKLKENLVNFRNQSDIY